MPRREVEFAPNQYYHVFNRAFNKMPIFCNKLIERKFFVKKAVELSDRFKVSIESLAMMDNHFHFILLQNEDNNGIQQMLYRLQMGFAKSYNIRRKRQGPVFESRYKAKLLYDSKYYRDATNYVFKNPIK